MCCLNNHRLRLKQRGRASILWGLTGFVAFQLGLAIAIERWVPELRDPEYGRRIGLLYRRTRGESQHPFTVVMLGSSRTTFGFQAAVLENYLKTKLQQPVVVFNFGITGAGPLMELIDLRRILGQGIRPDLLLVEVLPPFLTGQTSHELNRLPMSRVWLNELRLLERYGGRMNRMRNDWWEAWPVPCYEHRFAILSRLLPACVPYQLRMDWLYKMDGSGGVVGMSGRSPQDRQAGVARAFVEYAGYLAGFRLEGPSKNALCELLALCREQQLSTALVLMPEGSEFRSWYPPAVWQQIEGFLTSAGREYAAPVINAREWISDEDFTDSHHLLVHGGRIFTERLGREAVLPLIAQGR
jgi:hypothetical protein